MENFIDAKLPDSFASEELKTALTWSSEGQSFTILGVNSAGVSPFLKFFTSRTDAFVVHIDTFELASFTKEAFFELLYQKLTGKKKRGASFTDCKVASGALLKNKKRIVIIINKFDALHKDFSQEFLGNLRTLCHGTENRISFIFSVTRPYIEYAPDAISGSNMHMYTRYLYFPLYKEQDVLSLLRLHSPELATHQNLAEALELCGGHIQLLQLILRSETPQNPQHDPYIRLLFKQIYDDQTPARKKLLKRIAEGKKAERDIHLLRLGLIVSTEEGVRLFSSLFAFYLSEAKTFHFSAKEKKLFHLLKNSKGKILSKQKIFTTVWADDPNGATDWALDSTIYRLRKHPYLKERHFAIISHKKLGYQLIKEI